MGVIKMVEEWKCEFCGAREKMEAEKEVAVKVLEGAGIIKLYKTINA